MSDYGRKRSRVLGEMPCSEVVEFGGESFFLDLPPDCRHKGQGLAGFSGAPPMRCHLCIVARLLPLG
ncbi:hypothetical protein AMK27_38290 [Streptomyces sp. CB02009]|nr:hypothetical protein AMK27_38290 [Streptomyces sp. CB02009]